MKRIIKWGTVLVVAFFACSLLAVLTTSDEDPPTGAPEPAAEQAETTSTEAEGVALTEADVATETLDGEGSRETDTETDGQQGAVEPRWAEVMRVEGSTIKDTQTFTIRENEWRIRWDTEPGDMGDMNFIVTVYDGAGGIRDIAANAIGASEDATVMRGSGEYYLGINSAQPYTIVIEEKTTRPPSQDAVASSSDDGGWEEITRFEGSTIKDTESFTVSAEEWRIRWDTRPGDLGAMNFAITVFEADGTMKTIAANAVGESNDATVMRGSGEYYLSINSAQPYTIVVEER